MKKEKSPNFSKFSKDFDDLFEMLNEKPKKIKIESAGFIWL